MLDWSVVVGFANHQKGPTNAEFPLASCLLEVREQMQGLSDRIAALESHRHRFPGQSMHTLPMDGEQAQPQEATTETWTDEEKAAIIAAETPEDHIRLAQVYIRAAKPTATSEALAKLNQAEWHLRQLDKPGPMYVA